jgi:hypothetical protein
MLHAFSSGTSAATAGCGTSPSRLGPLAELGYPHELWTTRLLAAHARQHAPSAGHPSLAKLAQGTVCKILAEQEVKPHKSLPSRRRGCATTWNSVIPSSSPRWPKSSVSTGKS